MTPGKVCKTYRVVDMQMTIQGFLYLYCFPASKKKTLQFSIEYASQWWNAGTPLGSGASSFFLGRDVSCSSGETVFLDSFHAVDIKLNKIVRE